MSESHDNESELNLEGEELPLGSDSIDAGIEVRFEEIALEKVSREDFDLVDRFFADQLSEAEVKQLESQLAKDRLLRTNFVRYSGFVSDLQMSARVSAASENALKHLFGKQILDQGDPSTSATRQNNAAHLKAGERDLENARDSRGGGKPEFGFASGPHRFKGYISRPKFALGGVAAALVIGLVLGFWIPTRRETALEPVAWLVNAHDCKWANGFSPSANMRADDFLKLESGLVQVRFSSGVDVLIEGPAELMLISDMSAKLNRGKVSVKVPKSMKGFEIFSPQGRVLDLGTEFGVTVSGEGVTDVLVFDGEVETFVGDDQSKPVKLLENQSASISDFKINTEKSVDNNFVREISDAGDLVARKELSEASIVFDGSIQDGILDRNGRPIGFRSRLPGTGGDLPQNDSNLDVDFQSRLLRLTTTRSDINRQAGLATGEYFGFNLSDFGFTGSEDFSVTVEIPNIPNLENFGQVGLYCGVKSDQVIRGGFIKWGQAGPAPNTIFMVNNNGGDDSDSNKVGLLNAGIDLQLTLSRISDKYSLTVENLTDGGSASLSIRHPKHLDGQTDLHVGVFGANPFSDVRKTVNIKEFTIRIWK